jgi:diguanylate cyclase (GGDEF)-like protein/PAS domain S-box-containing protein
VHLVEQAFVQAPLGMAVRRLDGGFIRVNRAFCELLGYSEDELLALDPDELLHPEDRAVDDAGAATRPVERRYLRADGEPVWVSVATSVVHDDADRPRYLIIQVEDVSERKRLEADLRHAADHDPLTGLLNRRRFELDLTRQIELCRRYDQIAAVVLLDLDHLKQVNDSHGHQAGDELLVAVARALSDRLRASDVLARLGGDEFAVLLPLVRPLEGLGVAEALVGAVGDLGCTASAGVAAVDGERTDAAGVIEAADRAMYDAKRGGRARAVLAGG